MKELLEKFVRHLAVERGVSPLTVRNYTSDIQGFLDYLDQNGIENLEAVDRSVVRRYLGQLHAQGFSRGSISRKLSALRSFYRYLSRQGLVGSEPLSALSAPKIEKRLPKFLSKEEASRLVEAPDASTPKGLRDKAMLELLYAAGLRVSEIVGLDTGDIDLVSRQIRVWGKGSKERMGLIGKPAAEVLKVYLEHGRVKLMGRKETRALFLNRSGGRISERSVQRLIAEHARRAGLDMGVHPHMMRHTYATHLLDGGADLRVVQDLLGHAKLSTTQVYTHVTQNQIRRSYLAAHPRSSAHKGEE